MFHTNSEPRVFRGNKLLQHFQYGRALFGRRLKLNVISLLEPPSALCNPLAAMRHGEVECW